ncbi:hypothetical protein SAMD00019534_073210 [Acytostelium subglobosum LB1]|uniref:hypothetical protein n=1 Tax=Acytostelium subglobosum LB1 TaxID=1410327 RepID=UPI000644F457|nr:hypothetical protein SAMD00019534_073210 [Acytostelium subglobosum LB1]GAM24146.1 hypothetical protein SAMD00019534_073210 [Acytostelium subglobosum LB1]|eukprot:XP_012753182.1 hypothetical protein SAMD00019534_073210 [Acytostelium subglobosum LB1]
MSGQKQITDFFQSKNSPKKAATTTTTTTTTSTPTKTNKRKKVEEEDEVEEEKATEVSKPEDEVVPEAEGDAEGEKVTKDDANADGEQQDDDDEEDVKVVKKRRQEEADSTPNGASSTSDEGYNNILDHLTEKGWKDALAPEFKKAYFKKIITQLNDELKKPKVGPIYPPKNEIFTALNLTPLDSVRVVIVGQDPYHGAGQAHGLSFSVKKGIKAPPSLANIYKELISDIPGFKVPNHGFLEKWAKQGVLMLNAVLTVEQAKPNSHKKFGWAEFTDAIMNLLNTKEKIVFILWGGDAKKKGSKIDGKRHHIITSAHPSPLSVTKFLGSKPFSKTNEYLESIGSTAHRLDT